MSYQILSKRLQDKLHARSEYNKKNKIGTFVFELIGRGEPIPDTLPIVYCYKDADYAPTTTVSDPFDEKRPKKFLNHIIGERPIIKEGGVLDTQPVVDNATFQAGLAIVKNDDLNRLGWYMYSDHNETNPYRDHSVQARWRERIPNLHETHEKVADIRLKGKAIEYADRLSHEEMRTTLMSIFEEMEEFDPRMKGATAIQHDFFIFVDKYPRKFLEMAQHPKALAYVTVSDALLRGLIVKDEDNRNFFAKTGEDQELMFQYPVGKNPEQALVDWIATEKNSPWIDKMKERMGPKLHPYEA